MGFLAGSVQTSPGTNPDSQQARNGVLQFLGGGNQLHHGRTTTIAGMPVPGGGFDNNTWEADPNAISQNLGQIFSQAPDMSMLMKFLEPYSQMFNTTREQGLAQAKESAGNLSGSGYNNILGDSAASSIANQQAQLGNMLMGLRGQTMQNNQFNAGNFLQLLMGMTTAGVGPPQQSYQPGFLDYASSFAPAIGSYYGGK